MAPESLLITGASGYIGGTILSQILKTKDQWSENLQVSALVRKEEQATAVRKLGVTPVLFNNLDEVDRLEAIGKDFDVIIHAAAGWHVASAKALITGQGERRAKLQKEVHYLQISGTSNLSDNPHSRGWINNDVFSDEEDIYSFEKYRESRSAYHQRTTDVTVVETGEKFKVNTYIIMAPTIFGLGTGPFNCYSIQLPSLIGEALKSGHCSVVGDGKTRWSHVHIEDLASLHIVLLQKIFEGVPIPSGRKGIYFSETGEHTHLEFSERLAKAGVELGLLESANVQQVTLKVAGDKWAFGNDARAELAFASNSRTKAVLGRKLGWKPLHGNEWESTFKLELSEYQRRPPSEREIPQVIRKVED